jgi:CBS domain-containing protein
MLASIVSYGFVVLTMPRSILTEKIARRGLHIYREYTVDPLERYSVQEVMTRQVRTIDANESLAQVLQEHFGPSQSHRAFPVVHDGVLVGMLDREALLAGQASGVAKVAELFGANVPLVALPEETCRIVATRLAVHGVERLPVVQDAQSRRLVGLVARSDLIKPSLELFDEEFHRERLRKSMFSTSAD